MKTLIASLLVAVALSTSAIAAPRCADALVKCDGVIGSEKGKDAGNGERGDRASPRADRG
jgi:hypothetical protein